MKCFSKTEHNPSSITDFECKIPKYKNGKPLKNGEKKPQKLGIIQAVLQTLNAKFQKKGKWNPHKIDTIQALVQTLNAKFQTTKIGTTIYSN